MELTVIPSYESDKVTFRYSIRNGLDTEIYVPQFMPWRSGPTRACYVYAHADGQLLLYFGTVPNPPLICLAREIRLYAERVSAGRTLQSSVTLNVPILEEGKLQGEDAEAPHELVSLSRLTMTVNYYQPQRELRIEEVPGYGLYDVWGTTPRSLVANLIMPNPLPAKRRTDDFHRPFEH
jgi:hypothetical protein